MNITRPNPRSNECLREQEHRLDVDRLNLARRASSSTCSKGPNSNVAAA